MTLVFLCLFLSDSPILKIRLLLRFSFWSLRKVFELLWLFLAGQFFKSSLLFFAFIQTFWIKTWKRRKAFLRVWKFKFRVVFGSKFRTLKFLEKRRLKKKIRKLAREMRKRCVDSKKEKRRPSRRTSSKRQSAARNATPTPDSPRRRAELLPEAASGRQSAVQ